MFSARLRELREKHGISQKALAELIYVSQQAVAKYESGRATPNPETIKKISDIFNVTTDYLLGKNETATYPTDSDIKFALFNGAEGITDEMLEDVKQYAQFIKERRTKEAD